LAQFANVPLKDVGFAGLKDRHAVTRQWFSVPRWNTPDWSLLEVAGVRIARCERHLRKLRRGAHRSNTFAITLRLLRAAGWRRDHSPHRPAIGTRCTQLLRRAAFWPKRRQSPTRLTIGPMVQRLPREKAQHGDLYYAVLSLQ
jgi:hypothetical protein